MAHHRQHRVGLFRDHRRERDIGDRPCQDSDMAPVRLARPVRAGRLGPVWPLGTVPSDSPHNPVWDGHRTRNVSNRE